MTLFSLWIPLCATLLLFFVSTIQASPSEYVWLNSTSVTADPSTGKAQVIVQRSSSVGEVRVRVSTSDVTARSDAPTATSQHSLSYRVVNSVTTWASETAITAEIWGKKFFFACNGKGNSTLLLDVGDDFIPVQSIHTMACRQAKFFSAGGVYYLVIANRALFDSSYTTPEFQTDSYLYRFDTSTMLFETTPYQTFSTCSAAAVDVVDVTYNGENVPTMVLANYKYNSGSNSSTTLNSDVYIWDTTSVKFVKIQQILTHGAQAVKFMSTGNDILLGIANYAENTIVNGVTTVPTNFEVNSVVYSWNSVAGQFSFLQNIPTKGAVSLDFISVSGAGDFLLVGNYINNNRSTTVNSAVYSWVSNILQFVLLQNIQTTSVRDFQAFSFAGSVFLVASQQASQFIATDPLTNSTFIDTNHTFHSTVYVLQVSPLDPAKFVKVLDFPTISARGLAVLPKANSVSMFVGSYQSGGYGQTFSSIAPTNSTIFEFYFKDTGVTDYSALDSTYVLLAGQLSKTISIPLYSTALNVAPEQFLVKLSSPKPSTTYALFSGYSSTTVTIPGSASSLSAQVTILNHLVENEDYSINPITIARISATENLLGCSLSEIGSSNAEGATIVTTVNGDGTCDIMLNAASSFDREASPLGSSYYFKALISYASDSGGSGSVWVGCPIDDANDNSPLLSSSASASIFENQPQGTFLYSVEASDLDETSVLTYSIVSAKPTNLPADATLFSIDSSTGDIVTNTVSLDFETTTSYLLTILVSDSVNEAYQNLQVTVLDQNDNSPTFAVNVFPASFNLKETPGVSGTASGSSIGDNLFTNSFAVSDKDTASTYGQVTLSISSGNTGGSFTIVGDSASGFNVQIAKAIDYENVLEKSFMLVLTACDSGLKTAFNPFDPHCVNATVSVTVLDVNDNSPVFDSIPAFVYADMVESSPMQYILLSTTPLNTVLLTVSGSDVDSGLNGDLSFTMTSSTTLSIDSDSGSISLTSTLDHYTSYSASQVVFLKDKGTPVLSAATNLPVSFTFVGLPMVSSGFSDTLLLPESMLANVGVYTVSVVPQASTAWKFKIVSGNTLDKFAIGEDSGVLMLKSTVDFENSLEPTSYALEIQVYDAALASLDRYSTVTITITVVNTNDNAPTIDFPANSPYAVSLNEDDGMMVSGSSNTVVVDVDASDGDMLVALHYGIVSVSSITPGGSVVGNPSQFAIDPSSGVVSTAAVLDYESYVSHSIVVMVTDGSHNVTTQISVTVVDLNDNAPSFGLSSYSVKVNESIPVGSVVVNTITATDGDSGSTLTFSFNDSVAMQYFTLDTNSAQITLANPLQISVVSSFSFSVYCSDGVHTTMTSVMVEVTVVSKFAPQFTNIPLAAVKENMPQGTFVVNLTASDQDLNDILKFSLLNFQNIFAVNSQTGEITTLVSLDRENKTQYSLSVRVMDTANLFADQTLTVAVVDQNDNAPVFLQTIFPAVNVPENTAAGMQLFSIAASDADAAGSHSTVTYVLLSGDATKFALNSTTGVVSLIGALNSEAGDSLFTLLVTARDGGDPTSGSAPLYSATNITLTVNVVDQNDNAPTFSPTSSSVSRNEDFAIGGVIYTVLATDSDVTSPNNLVTYSLISSSSPGLFTVDSLSGEVYLQSPGLNFESSQVHSLVVLAKDGGNASLSSSPMFTLTINVGDVNDNSPVFSKSVYNGSTLENIAHDILVVAASDADALDAGKLRFSFASAPSPNPFTLNAITGQLSAVAGMIDYETLPAGQKYYSLKITVTDDAGHTGNAWVYVSVQDENDNSPIFDAPFDNAGVNRVYLLASVPENTTIGRVLVTVKATDKDSGVFGNIASYSFNPGGSDNSMFSINSTTGVVRLAKALDAETAPANGYTVKVVASDGGPIPNVGYAFIRILVVGDYNEYDPTFVGAPFNAQISESDVPSYVVATFTYTDQDRDSALFTPSVSVDSDPTNGAFAVRFKSVTMMNTIELYLANSVDREAFPGPLQLVISVRDNAWPSSRTGQAMVTVVVNDVNDNAPQFSTPLSVTASVYENLASPVSVYTASATDNDLAGSPNSQITYMIDSVIPGPSSNFAIDSNSGEVMTNAALDREAQETYTVTVKAVDNGSPAMQSSNMKVITLAVLDKNDKTPTFDAASYSGSILENAPLYAAVMDTATQLSLQVSAHDDDKANSPNSAFGFSIASIQARRTSSQAWENVAVLASPFGVNSLSGAFSVSNPANLDREAYFDKYELTVQVEDGGVPSLSSTVLVMIDILDYNDNAPVFDQGALLTLDFTEENSPNDVVGTVSATDADIGVNAQIEFTLTQNPSNKFAIGLTTGIITALVALDRDAGTTSYTLEVTASNPAGVSPPQSSSISVQISLLDINDNSPTFLTSFPYLTSITENVASNTIVSLSAQDVDAGTNAQIHYEIVPNKGDFAHFSIMNNNEVVVSSAFDRESQTSFEVYVVAVDGGGLKSSEGKIYGGILDQNDVTPAFPTHAATVSVNENNAVGSVIFNISAYDNDTAPNAVITYSLLDISLPFTISTGADGSVLVVAAVSFDYENTNFLHSYNVVILASDGVNSITSLSNGGFQLTVNIQDVNDNKPVFDMTVYPVLDFVENSPLNTLVTTVHASDADESGAAQIWYFFVPIEGYSQFSIDSTTGNIYATGSPVVDREMTPFLNLSVHAKDVGDKFSDPVYVLIKVVDTNDNSPSFGSSSFSVSIAESFGVGNEVAKHMASDSDEGSFGSIAGYAITGGNTDSRFGIIPASGSITLASALDYDSASQPHQYMLEVTATDGGGNTGSYTLVVNVTPVDDESPVFNQLTYDIYINEQPSIGTMVANISAMDPDIPPSKLIYAVLGNGVASKNGTSEIVVTTSNSALFDPDAPNNVQTLSFVLFASDEINALTQTTVTLHFNDLNDNAPKFDSNSYTYEVNENELPNFVLSPNPHATDADASTLNSEVSYSIQESSGYGPFTVNSVTGAITVTASLDYETTSMYSFHVVGTDNGTPAQSSIVPVVIKVKDRNDHAPYVFDPAPVGSMISGSIPENMPANSIVFKITAMDQDSGLNGMIDRFEVLDMVPFTIDNDGFVYTLAPLDAEAVHEYNFKIEIFDKGTPVMSTQIDVTIVVNDLNEFGPMFTQQYFSRAVIESFALNTPFLTVTASDQDWTFSPLGLNAPLGYAIGGGNVGDVFYMEPTTGELSLQKPLQRSMMSFYYMQVVVSDGDVTSDCMVFVTVDPELGSGPTWTSTTMAMTSTTTTSDSGSGAGMSTVSSSTTGGMTTSTLASMGPSSTTTGAPMSSTTSMGIGSTTTGGSVGSTTTGAILTYPTAGSSTTSMGMGSTTTSAPLSSTTSGSAVMTSTTSAGASSSTTSTSMGMGSSTTTDGGSGSPTGSTTTTASSSSSSSSSSSTTTTTSISTTTTFTTTAAPIVIADAVSSYFDASWTGISDLNSKRTAHSGALFGKTLYVAGGSSSSGTNLLNSVEYYDPDEATPQWKLSTLTLTTARSHAAGLAVKDKESFAVCGGSDAGGSILSSCELLNVVYENSTSMGSMMSPRASFAMVLYLGKVVAIGGLDDNNAVVDTVETYVTKTNTWTGLPALKVARKLHAAAILAGKIFVSGGIDSAGNILSSVETYDGTSWALAGKPLPAARKGHQATAINGKMYILGGSNGAVQYLVVEVYNGYYDTWSSSEVPAMSEVHENFVAFAIPRDLPTTTTSTSHTTTSTTTDGSGSGQVTTIDADIFTSEFPTMEVEPGRVIAFDRISPKKQLGYCVFPYQFNGTTYHRCNCFLTTQFVCGVAAIVTDVDAQIGLCDPRDSSFDSSNAQCVSDRAQSSLSGGVNSNDHGVAKGQSSEDGSSSNQGTDSSSSVTGVVVAVVVIAFVVLAVAVIVVRRSRRAHWRVGHHVEQPNRPRKWFLDDLTQLDQLEPAEDEPREFVHVNF